MQLQYKHKDDLSWADAVWSYASLKQATELVPNFEWRIKPEEDENKMPNENIHLTLEERGKNYGSFDGHAKLTQNLKKVFNDHFQNNDNLLTASQSEALAMIFHKIGRIGNGNPNYRDSWIDIAGYATLVADQLEDK